jgi:hypothetical protein
MLVFGTGVKDLRKVLNLTRLVKGVQIRMTQPYVGSTGSGWVPEAGRVSRCTLYAPKQGNSTTIEHDNSCMKLVSALKKTMPRSAFRC